MKRKLLSLVLCLTLLFTTVFTGFTVVSAEEAATTTDNLLTNGDFESYTDGVLDNWQINNSENAVSEIVEDVEIAEGVTKNAVKFTTTADNSGKRSEFHYTDTVAIEKNAKYTTTYWVKVKNVKGFRTYMYEPDYVALDGTNKHQNTAAEGQNIYSFSYDNGATRVIRTDIKHTFTIAETGTVIDGGGPSMFISRSGGVEQPLTPDYPSTERQDEWFQIIHTFETGNDDAHKANISYQFSIPEAVDGELWIADVQMNVERNYVPEVNDDTLGAVVEGTRIPVTLGEELTLTASPFGLNSFLGWYVGDELVSEEAELTFIYEGNATPQYTAHFEANAASVVNTFEEGYTNGQTIAQATATTGPADTALTEFANTEVDGSGFFVDSNHAGDWRKATISNAYAQSGQYSLKYFGAYGDIGYKFTGLEKNKDYTLSVWAYLTYTPSTDWAGVRDIVVTPGNASYLDTSKRLFREYNDEKWANTINDWTKIEIDVNTGDNTEVILWVDSCGKDANLYLDNYSITPAAISYTPNVNDNTLGYVNTVNVRPGAKTTIKAGTYGEAIFDGWYNGDTLLSKNEKYTFVYSDEAANYEARFISSGFGIDGGFENFTNGQTLAQLQHTIDVGKDGSTWTSEIWKTTSLDGNNEYFMESNNGGNYRKATISNAFAYAGQYSLKFEGKYGYMGRKFTGLTANTDYIISFYAMATEDANGLAQYGSVRITDANTSPILDTGTTISPENCLAGSYTNYGTLNEWEKFTYKFNSGDNTEVIFWLNHNKTSPIYIDNFAITRTAEFEVESSLYGTTDIEGTNKVGYNEKVTVTATPLEGNTFDGWYIGDELVSTDATYTFYAEDGLVLTPKFSGNTYEHFAANGQDGTFETGAIEDWPWSFSDPNWSVEWCNVKFSNSAATSYQGVNSLRIDARHRNSILPLTGLDKNTNYTISFMYKLNEIEAANADTGVVKKTQLSSAGIVTSDVTHIYESTEALAKTGPIDSTADWQKIELSFNTGDNTDLNLIIRFASESTAPMYLDNLTLVHKDTVTPESVAGDIDGSGEAGLSDVTALAQYLAGWDTAVNEEALDVNGDNAVNLKDLVLLAQFVAGWEVTLSNTPYVPA